jgi:UDP-N-acetylmuramate--alanine ligase
VTRTALELAGHLAPARDARPIRPGERIHVLGIAGAGASAAAIHAASQGAIVTGCDPGGPSPYTPALEALRIPIAWSHHASHVTDGPPLDRLAVTKALTAVSPDHPELRAAARRGIPTEPWQQVVADAAHGRRLIAVAGTHGKSTTSGWLTWVLAEVGLDPSAFVGALLPAALSGGIPTTARVGRGASFVVEADEYAGNFDAYRPDLIVLTGIEWDHPDVFEDRDAVIDAFARWIARAPGAWLVANTDDPGVVRLLARVQADGADGVHLGGTTALSVTGRAAPEATEGASEVGFESRLTATIVDRLPEATVVDIEGLGEAPLRTRLSAVGDHNVANALAVLAAAAGALEPDRQPGADVTPDRLAWALSTFPGIGRRLERKGKAKGVVVYDDYGHHPTAIRATLAALRQREPDRRIWAMYEPLTFHRTAAMVVEFADVLAEADAVAIADIWASRDLDTTAVSPEILAAAVRARRPGITSRATGSVEETAAWLAGQVQDGDAVLVMGGGRSYRIAELLLERLEAADR